MHVPRTRQCHLPLCFFSCLMKHFVDLYLIFCLHVALDIRCILYGTNFMRTETWSGLIEIVWAAALFETLHSWRDSDSWQKLSLHSQKKPHPKIGESWRTVNDKKPNHDTGACNRLNEMGALCDKKCIRWIKEEKIPRFPFCFIPFHLFHVREWIIAKTMEQKKRFLNKKAAKRLQFEHINALNILDVQLNEKRKMKKNIQSIKDEQKKMKDIKIQLNRMKRAYYIYNLKWLFISFPTSIIIEWLFVLFCLLMLYAICLVPFS